MAIAFRGSASNTQSNGTDITLTLSGISGLAEGDFVILTHGMANAADQTLQEDYISFPAGWTRLGHLYANDTEDVNFAAWCKFMGPIPDTAVTIRSTGTTTESIAAVAMAFSGVDQTRPLDVLPTTATGINTGIPDPPSITTSGAAGAWTVIAGASASDNGFLATFTFPTGYTTNALEAAGNDTDDIMVGMGYNSSPSSPENPGVMTPSYGDSVNYAWAAMTIALRPTETAGIHFVGSAKTNAANGADLTLTLPTCLENDLVIVAANIPTNSDIDVAMDSTTPGGAGSWTEVADLNSFDSNQTNLGVFYKKMGATPDTTAVVDGLGNASDGNSAVALVFRNVDTSTPMDVAATTATGANSGFANPPSINQADANTVIVVAAGTAHTAGDTHGYIFPKNYIGVGDVGNDTRDSLVALAYAHSGLVSDPEDPGAFSELGLLGVPNGLNSWAAVTMALRTVAAAGTGGFISVALIGI